MTNRDHDASMDRLLREAMAGEVRAASECLDAATLAAWADGALNESERSLAEAHASSCSRCQATLAAMVRTAVPASAAARPSWRRWMTMLVPAMAAAAAVSLWFAVDRRAAEPPAPQSPSATVQTADAPARPTSQLAAANEAAKAVGDERDRVKPPAREAKRADTDRKADLKKEDDARSADKERFAFRVAQPEAAPPPPPASPPPLPDAVLARPSAAAEPAPKLPTAGLQPVEQLPPPQQRQNAATQGQQAAQSKAEENELRGAGRGGAGTDTASASTRRYDGSIGIRQERSATFDVQSPQPAIRWRIADGRVVQRSTDTGATWREQYKVAPPLLLAAGASPSPTACWLVGRAGLVLRTRDGRTWQRITFPETVDLNAVSAADVNVAAIVTADHRTFTTSNGGATWVLQK